MVTSTLDDQLALLDRLLSSGQRIGRVELGNELAGNDLKGVFPDGRSYATAAASWIQAIKQRWPELPVGVTANLASTGNGQRKAAGS